MTTTQEAERDAERDRIVACLNSPSGQHQVDTSMESGPNNCFYCEKPMPTGKAAIARNEHRSADNGE